MTAAAATTASTAMHPSEKLGVGSIGIASVPRVLDLIWAMPKRLTVCLVGETGIGKTPIVHQWAKNKGFPVVVLNLGHMSSEDMSMSMFNEDATNFDFVMPKYIHEINELARKNPGVVFFLDEINRCGKEIVNKFFTIPDERRIHDFKLEDNVLIVAAMNPSDGTYMVNNAERDHAIRKRLSFIFATHDLVGFLNNAREQDFHKDVVDFVRMMPNHLYGTAARDAGRAFECPSSWEKVSNVLKAADSARINLLSAEVQVVVQGQIGMGASAPFFEFLRDRNSLISPEEVFTAYLETDAQRRDRLRVSAKSRSARQRVVALTGRVLNDKGEAVLPTGANPEDAVGVRTDALMMLCESIAVSIVQLRPTGKEFITNFTAFFMDLPDELTAGFWAGPMRSALTQAPSPELGAYMKNLSTELNANAAYKARMRQRLDDQEAALNLA